MKARNELTISKEDVCYLILKAKEFHAKEEVTFPEKIPNSEYEYDPMQILADHKDDLTYLEIKKIIENLEPHQQIDLLALMYLGREDYDFNEWEAARKEAALNIGLNLPDYLMSKPLIANYLEQGLALFGYSCEV